jgi:hypothetical protein
MNRDAVFIEKGFEEDNELDTCRFWLMLKMKFGGEYWDDKYTMYLDSLRKELYSMCSIKRTVDNKIEAIQLSAYRTIPQSFF